MNNYTDADLDDAYRRYARALDLHREALRLIPVNDPRTELHHLDYLASSRLTCDRTFARYEAIARELARRPLSERPQPA